MTCTDKFSEKERKEKLAKLKSKNPSLFEFGKNDERRNVLEDEKGNG